jgi:hypothetical protein
MAFLWACQHGHLGLVSLSLKLRKQKLSSSKVCQGFHLACINGHANIVEKLLQEPDFEPLPESSSVFLQVVRLGHTLVVQKLLEDGRADPTANDNAALRHTVHTADDEILKLLLEDGRADPGQGGGDMLVDACIHSSCAVILLLLGDSRVDPSQPDDAPFRRLTTRMSLGEDLPLVVELFLTDDRVNPAANRNEAFANACIVGQVSTVKALLADPRVDPIEGSERFLAGFSKLNREFDVLRLLVRSTRVDISPYACNLWFNVCRYGDVGLVKDMLRDPRVDPTVANNMALRHASYNRRFMDRSASDDDNDVVKVLLKDGRCDPSSCGSMLLIQAIVWDDVDSLMEWLNDKRVNPGAEGGDAVWRAHVTPTTCANVALNLFLLDERVDVHTHLKRAFGLLHERTRHTNFRDNLIYTNERAKRLLFKHKFSAHTQYGLAEYILAQSCLSRRTLVLCIERMYRRGGRNGRRAHATNDIVRSIVCEWLPFMIERSSLKGQWEPFA